MGSTFQTEMAYLRVSSDETNPELTKLDGQLIGTAKAKYLLENYENPSFTFEHVMLRNVPVIFNNCKERENYFRVNAKYTKNLSDAEKASIKLHPLHYLASEYISKGSFDTIILDGKRITFDSVLSYMGDRVKVYCSNNDKDYVIPDAIINTPYMSYYLEFTNTHKLENKKLIKYRRLKSYTPNPFTVIEIDISDLCKDMKTNPNLVDYKGLLIQRINGISEFKHTVDLSTPKEEEFKPFGECYACGTPLALATNPNDENFSNRLPTTIKRMKVQLKGLDESEKVSTGSAIAYCPHCEAEHRFHDLYCPECSHNHGIHVPLKLLMSAENRVFLICPHCLMQSEREHGVTVPEDKECGFSCTVFDVNGNYDNQIKAVRNCDLFYKGSTYKSTLKRLKQAEADAKKIWKEGSRN